MIIERLQVEEGFLDGLDLVFTPGLNVLIGPRGSGKTSVLELLRFCFGVQAFTQKASAAARQHALSVLGPTGRVTVTTLIAGQRVVASRAADDDKPRYQVSDRPIVLSQGDIESVGLDAAGRLRLIDGFRAGTESTHSDLASTIRSLTVQLQDLSREIAKHHEQADAIAGVVDELREAETAEAELVKGLAELQPDHERLGIIGVDLASLSVRLGVFERVGLTLQQWRESVVRLVQAPPRIEKWPEAAESDDPLGGVRTRAQHAVTALQTGIQEIEAAGAELERLRTAQREREIQLSDNARDLRKRLEAVQEGAGGASRRVAQLRERAGQLAAIKGLIAEKQADLARLQGERLKLLDQLDTIRDGRFRSRLDVAEKLNRDLGPRIEVRVKQGAATAEYASAIASTLRGSGLHYSNLAPRLAERLSPREFVEAVESGNATLIASLGGIGIDRAARLIEHAQESGCEDVLTSAPEDTVELLLLDGKEYKATEGLSTGQRCTVVLPILLDHRGQALLVDEPEAHLDNAFVVGTVIKILRTRDPTDESQFIFATHNANVPVLGEAEHVILLGSDGARGFVRHDGPLDDDEIVDAVALVMEGGREAFERRASFYREHGN